MFTSKSFDSIQVTPYMLAEEAGRRIIRSVIHGQVKTKCQLHALADKCGKGADIVKDTRHFAMALMLTR